MPRQDPPRHPGFLEELRQQLAASGRWIVVPVAILIALVLIVLILGSLDALPFIYDSF